METTIDLSHERSVACLEEEGGCYKIQVFVRKTRKYPVFIDIEIMSRECLSVAELRAMLKVLQRAADLAERWDADPTSIPTQPKEGE